MSRQSRNHSPSADNEVPQTEITLYADKPNPFGITLEIITAKWASENVNDDSRRTTTTDALRCCIPSSNPQDVHLYSAKIHSDFAGIDLTMPSLTYHRREQSTLTNAALEQKFGACEPSAKAYGRTYMMARNRHPSTTVSLRFEDFDSRSPIYVTNKFFNGINPVNEFALQTHTSATPYENERILGMDNCTSVNTQAIYLLAIYNTATQATVDVGPLQNDQDFDSLNQLMRSGAGGTFTGDVFQTCSSRAPFPANQPSFHAYHPSYHSPSMPPPAHHSTPSRRAPAPTSRSASKPHFSPPNHSTPSGRAQAPTRRSASKPHFTPRTSPPRFNGMPPVSSRAFRSPSHLPNESFTSESEESYGYNTVETVDTPESVGSAGNSIGRVLNDVLGDINRMANDDMSVDDNHPDHVSSNSRAPRSRRRGSSNPADNSGLSGLTAQISISSSPSRAQQSPPTGRRRGQQGSRRIARSHQGGNQRTTKYARGRDSSTSPSL